MFRRYELHNHTTESDASITCRELVDIMVRDHADAFALTDHNTISGHRIVKDILASSSLPIQCVYGMEYTTYYGHILCLNLDQYVPWDSIDRRHPEKLFEACRAAGALTGIAHPFSYGHPFARGCRFDMTVHDFSSVDFIEIFNNPEPLQINLRGLEWWEELTLRGERLAVTAGMDLHGDWNMAMNFGTYIDAPEPFDAPAALAHAIRARRTWISKGILLNWEDLGDAIRYTLVDVQKPGFVPAPPYTLSLLTPSGETRHPIPSAGLTLPKSPLQIPKLYAGDELICVAPVVRG